jgi:hypothetical protein
MRDWRTKLDEFLRYNDRAVLPHAGRVSREAADKLAHERYEAFHQRRLTELDAKAERETMEALDQLAKTLPKRKKSARKGKS